MSLQCKGFSLQLVRLGAPDCTGPTSAVSHQRQRYCFAGIQLKRKVFRWVADGGVCTTHGIDSAALSGRLAAVHSLVEHDQVVADHLGRKLAIAFLVFPASCTETTFDVNLSLKVSVVARGNFATAILPSNTCTSGSLPRLPISITLFTPLIRLSFFRLIIVSRL